MEWNLRKTYDSQYYHLVNVRYNYYYKTINIQVTKVDNGQKIWVGETTVPSNSECRLRLCCAGENMSVQIDGKTIYTWEDDISYPQDAKYTVTERAWSTVRASAYVLMDNYKIAEDTGIRNLDVFIDEITFNKNDGGVISGSEKLVDGIYALRVNLNNLNEEAKNVDIIIGIYQNNMLIDVKIVPVVIEADTYSQTVEVLFDLDCTKIDTKEPIELKGFMFDSMKNLRPLITNTSAEGMTIVDSSLDVIQFYSFNDDILPNCFSDKMFITENGMLRANGAGSRFVFSDMPKNCSFEFKIKPLKDMYIPKFQVIIGNSAFTFCDNNRQKNSWDDKFSVYNNITWGSALKEMWANGTFFPDAKNGHTIKYVSNNDTYTLYIDDINIGEVSYTGVADNYKVSFTVADDAAIGMYIDDITVKYLE